MKTSWNNLAFILASWIVFTLTACSYGENASPNLQRWDLRIIDEARINKAHLWFNLLTEYSNARYKEAWSRRKAALQEVVEKYPASQWADDAAVILACGKYEFEGDRDGAIADLKAAVAKYPNGHSIVDTFYWPIGEGCRLDGVFVHTGGSLVVMDPNGEIKKTYPFDRNGEIHQKGKEILAYFAHLERYPIYTRDVANVSIAKILLNEKDYSGAVAAVETVVADANRMSRVARADKIAASDPNGFFLEGVYRPEYAAYTLLVYAYGKLGDKEKAIAKLDACSAIVNQSHRYSMMLTMGRFYKHYGLRSKARAQYQRALQQLEEFIEAERERGVKAGRPDSTDKEIPERYKHSHIRIKKDLNELSED